MSSRTMPCPRCGIERQVHEGRKNTLCRDCKILPCGTYAAYKRHIYYGDKPCNECLQAAREHDRARRRSPRRSSPQMPVDAVVVKSQDDENSAQRKAS